jgi:hypothetical protein
MRTPREIYSAYNIMPNLQLHQLRVAAVGKLICENFKQPVDKDDVILACLFHDMGNILKFDLTYFPDAVEPEGLAYWEGVKADYEKKYGPEQHAATEALAREIGLPERVVQLIGMVRFGALDRILGESTWEPKIIEYGDCRVAPYGIVPIRERFLDGRKRYLHRFPTAAENDAHYDRLTAIGYELEQQIFAHAHITPEDISDTSGVPVIEELWEYPVNP